MEKRKLDGSLSYGHAYHWLPEAHKLVPEDELYVKNLICLEHAEQVFRETPGEGWGKSIKQLEKQINQREKKFSKRHEKKEFINYVKIFHGIESGLLKYGTRTMQRAQLQAKLDEFKGVELKTRNDDNYFHIMVMVTFYSGFRASTVSKRESVIKAHFPSVDAVATYTDHNEDQIMADTRMIRNRRKIKACIENAKVLKKLSARYGSFKAYLDSFEPNESFENLMLLKEDLEGHFSYLGGITVYHFLTDIGLKVLKPDRVICRIFKRLGLIENENQLLKTVIHGRKMAEQTQLDIRYIDIVLVAYGQEQSEAFGIDKGICLSKPRCEYCDKGIKDLCSYAKS